MAEGRTVNRERIVCRFYLNSSCRDGDRCKYSHDAPRNSSDRICRFFLQGRCKYGERCMFDHVRPKENVNVKTHSRNDKYSPSTSKSSRENRESAQAGQSNANKSDAVSCKFTYLRKNKRETSNSNAFGPGSSNWVNAPEFIPKAPRSYADTLKSNSLHPTSKRSFEMCPYSKRSECLDLHCRYVHYELCDICRIECLHPFDNEQRKQHIELCEKELEEDMELSFAIQRSIDKTCGICFDAILEKEPISERQFGILEKCNHIFCLSCIRKWRSVKQFENSQHFGNVLDPVVTRGCPECRVTSNFVTPSPFWVDNEEEKAKLIKNYKEVLSKKACKYFKQGEGNCPFGGACFYLHAKPDGTKVELPLPTRRRRQNQDGELDFMNRIFLWDYLEFREENILMHLEFDDLISTWSDSEDDSDESELPLFF